MYQSDPWPQSNTEWVAALSGQLGVAQQHQSHTALGNYLYTVGFNHLVMRQADLPLLTSFADQDLATLAEEFVQDFLIRLTVNDYARLKGYQGKGTFQKWAAVGLKRLIEKDLEKKNWHERERLPDQEDAQLPPQHSSVIEHLPTQLALEHCLQALKARDRMVFLRRAEQDESAQSIADDLHSTANAVNIVFLRAKNHLRHCLERQGILSSKDLD